MRHTIHNRQSLLDIAVQECGATEAAYSLAQRNGIAITDDLAAGEQIAFVPKDVLDKRVAASMKAYGAKPATAVSESDIALVPWSGIGLMGIEIDFIVS